MRQYKIYKRVITEGNEKVPNSTYVVTKAKLKPPPEPPPPPESEKKVGAMSFADAINKIANAPKPKK